MRACYLMWVCQWEGRVTSCGYRTVIARQVHLNLGGAASTPSWVVLSHGTPCRDHKTWGLPMWCGDAAVEGLSLHH